MAGVQLIPHRTGQALVDSPGHAPLMGRQKGLALPVQGGHLQAQPALAHLRAVLLHLNHPGTPVGSQPVQPSLQPTSPMQPVIVSPQRGTSATDSITPSRSQLHWVHR